MTARGGRNLLMVLASAALLLLVGAGLKSIPASGQAVHPATPAPPEGAAVYRCEQAHGVVCNPTTYATQVAEDPLAQPPSAHPHFISEREAIVEARLAARGATTPVAPANSVIYATLMSRHDLDAAMKEVEPLSNPNRMVWVVAVYADKLDDHSFTLIHGYTVVIDAETRIISDLYGAPVLSSEGAVPHPFTRP